MSDPLPVDAKARQVIRDRYQAAALAEAQREALIRGRSMKCAGQVRVGLDYLPKPWHADEVGGCANTGAQCICECHDQEETP